MEKGIRIQIGERAFEARLNDTKIAGMIWEALPISAPFNFWGDEIYFSIPVREKTLEFPKEVVEAGDLGYWPDGPCFCIFYGLTPISSPGIIKPASPVEVIGRVEDYKGFKGVKGTAGIILERK
jgi:uncharacterized protein